VSVDKHCVRRNTCILWTRLRDIFLMTVGVTTEQTGLSPCAENWGGGGEKLNLLKN
jgi:hypothetical protein